MTIADVGGISVPLHASQCRLGLLAYGKAILAGGRWEGYIRRPPEALAMGMWPEPIKSCGARARRIKEFCGLRIGVVMQEDLPLAAIPGWIGIQNIEVCH